MVSYLSGASEDPLEAEPTRRGIRTEEVDMKNRRRFSIRTTILAVLLVPAQMPAQGPVKPDVSVPDLWAQ